jgi:sugar phosphate isomerase/epimerase
LALEFQAKSTYPNNLQSAVAVVEEIGDSHLGLCLDAFHFFNGPSKETDLAYLTTENLFHVQLCDLVGVSREFANDADRVLPGDGDFPLAQIVNRLRAIGYAGCVSVELLDPAIWRIGPRQVCEVAMTALRKLLGMASMG